MLQMKKTMEPLVLWEDRFSIGIPLVDNQHKHLIELANELHFACRLDEASARKQFGITVREAVAYVKYHFSTEEQIMEKTAFPGLSDHKKQHLEFIREVVKYVKAFESGKRFVPNLFLRFLLEWIMSHIAVYDSKLGGFIVELQKTGKLGKITMKAKT